MSPKESSLAYDEVKLAEVEEYEPRLEVLIGKKNLDSAAAAHSEATRLEGRITVSF